MTSTPGSGTEGMREPAADLEDAPLAPADQRAGRGRRLFERFVVHLDRSP